MGDLQTGKRPQSKE